MDDRGRFAGLRFLDARDLKGATVLDPAGSSLGTVSALMEGAGGDIEVLVAASAPGGRIQRFALDDLEIDELGRLWRRPRWRVYRIAVPLPAESLTER
ncbi:MAG: PRC-barrel domain-containing protein [Candidatus Dormibacteria bacterium]